MKLLLVACLAIAGSAQAQPGPHGSAPVTVVNTPGNPVPVTGTVTLQGGAGAITGAVSSADKTVVVYDASIGVNSTTFGNAGTPLLEVGDYKEVRLVVQAGSCSPCGDPIVAYVTVQGASGLSYQIDQFPVSQAAAGIGFWETRTYTVPGLKMSIGLRASVPGSSHSVRVLVAGRSN